MNIVISVLCVMFTSICFAADATSNSNPLVSMTIKVEKSACSTTYEKAVTSSGRGLICFGGVWNSIGKGGASRVSNTYVITPSDNNTTKVLVASCPATKQVIGGDCNFNGGTTKVRVPLSHTSDYNGYWCFFTLDDVYQPTMYQNLITSADCIDK